MISYSYSRVINISLQYIYLIRKLKIGVIINNLFGFNIIERLQEVFKEKKQPVTTISVRFSARARLGCRLVSKQADKELIPVLLAYVACDKDTVRKDWVSERLPSKSSKLSPHSASTSIDKFLTPTLPGSGFTSVTF